MTHDKTFSQVVDLRKKLASEVMVPILKEAGFKKRQYEWNRKKAEFTEIIDLYKYRYTELSNPRLRVTVNISYPKYGNILFGDSLDAWQKDSHGLVRYPLSKFAMAKEHDLDVNSFVLDPSNFEIIFTTIRVQLELVISKLNLLGAPRELDLFLKDNGLEYSTKSKVEKLRYVMLLHDLGDKEKSKYMFKEYVNDDHEIVKKVRNYIQSVQ